MFTCGNVTVLHVIIIHIADYDITEINRYNAPIDEISML